MNQTPSCEQAASPGWATTARPVTTGFASPIWLILTAAGVLYGSLLPLNMHLGMLHWSSGFGIGAIQWHGGTLEDIITNLAVYLPIGLAAGVWLLSRRVRLSLGLAIAALIGLALSTLAESIQTTMPMRVASWLDVVLNTSGSAAGAMAAYACRRGFLAPLATRWAGRLSPLSILTTAIALGLIIVEMAPFDFTTSTAALHRSFHAATWTISSAAFDTDLAAAVAALGIGAWFGAFAYLTALSARAEGHTHAAAATLAGLRGVTIVVVVELLQLFAVSPVFELSSIVLRSVAAAIGAAASCLVTGRTVKGAVPSAGLILIALFAVLQATSAAADARLTSTVAGRLPFETLWLSPMPVAGVQIARSLLTYGLYVLAVGVCLRRGGIRHAWLIAGGTALFMALMLASLESTGPAGLPDLTRPILAALAALTCAYAYPMLRTALLAAPVRAT